MLNEYANGLQNSSKTLQDSSNPVAQEAAIPVPQAVEVTLDYANGEAKPECADTDDASEEASTENPNPLTAKPYARDPYLASRLPPLPADNRAKLKANILEHGGLICPLVVWKEKGLLVDGHHRDELVDELQHEIPGLKLNCPITQKSFADEAAVVQWIFANQDGQRVVVQFEM